MRISFRTISQHALGASAATALTLLISGCGLGSAGDVATSSAPVTAAAAPGSISGRVHGGQNPVTGAAIQLYEVGTTGYTTGIAKPLIASTQQSGGVNAVTVTAGGAGYTSNFAVSFSGGGGSGAAGTAIVSGGAVTSVTITAAGSGYTSAPTVSFASGGGSASAVGTALITGNGDAITDANGGFNITGDYNCDAGAYVYIAAYGGNPGNGAVNPNIAMIAALGPCSVLKANAATTNITIDEVTTVAAAYAMAQFTGGSNFGVALSAQPGVSGTQAPADNFTTSSTNTQGIANAMAIASVLANTSTGTSPGGNTNGTATPEYWQVNNIANILAACVNSASPFANCNTLYSTVNPLGGTASPADTLQAALALAQKPVLSQGTTGQTATLFGLIGTSAPFQPYSSAYTAIHDFTVAIAYNPVVPGSSVSTAANTLVFEPENIAFDKYGNAWIANEVNGANDYGGTCTGAGQAGCAGWIVELDPTGNPIPAGSSSVGGTTVGAYEVNSYSVGNSATATNYQGHSDGSGNPPMGIAIDTNNNVWVADYSNNNVMVVPGSGAVYTSAGTAGASGSGIPATYNGGNGVGNGSNATTGAYGYAVGTGTTNPTALAIDGNNDVFISTISGSYLAPATGKTNTGIGNAKGLVTFVGGSPSNVNYAEITGSPYILAIDSGTKDTVSVNGTATTIPGSPFVWASSYNSSFVNQAFTSTGSGTVSQGYPTPVSYNGTSYGIGGANTSGIATTVPVANGTLSPAINNDPITAMIATNNQYGLTTDGLGNTWVSSLGAVDTNSAAKYVLTKITPNYGSSTTTAAAAFTSSNFAANATYVEFHDVGGLNSAVTGSAEEARFITTDGGGNIWWAFNTGFVGAISNTGTALSPAYGATTSNGFGGATTPTGTYFTGTTITYSRVANPKQPQVDLSGNVWVPVQSGPWPNLTVLVGAAVPLASPSSSALAAGKYGQMP